MVPITVVFSYLDHNVYVDANTDVDELIAFHTCNNVGCDQLKAVGSNHCSVCNFRRSD